MHDTTPYPATPDELSAAIDDVLYLEAHGVISPDQAMTECDQLWDAYHERLPDDWRMYLDPLYADTIKGAQARLRAAVLELFSPLVAIVQRIERRV